MYDSESIRLKTHDENHRCHRILADPAPRLICMKLAFFLFPEF